jgi:hypothetical protein
MTHENLTQLTYMIYQSQFLSIVYKIYFPVAKLNIEKWTMPRKCLTFLRELILYVT